MNNKSIIIVVVVLFILGGIVYFSTNDDTDTVDNQTTPDETTNSDSNTAVEGGKNSNTGSSNSTNNVVLSPTKTGNFVTVESATLTKPGYVVVYRVNSNSETEVMGNSDLLLPGSYNNLNIQLDSVIALEQTIVAVLHEDDGDGEFEYPGSDIYLGNTSRPVVSDVDVVDVAAEDENKVLQEQVEVFLENNFDTSTSVQTN